MSQKESRNPFGDNMMLVKEEKSNKGAPDGLQNGRLQNQNLNEYEIQKYMQPKVDRVRMPDMPTYMRAEDNDPQSYIGVKVIKSCITSYFNTVRKSMNDMVPKTVMAFLVNKTKNRAQRELVSALYNEHTDLKELL
jgi:hypothetical protein